MRPKAGLLSESVSRSQLHCPETRSGCDHAACVPGRPVNSEPSAVPFVPFAHAGAAVGGLIGRALGMYQSGEATGFIMSLIGAIILLILYRLLFKRAAA